MLFEYNVTKPFKFIDKGIIRDQIEENDLYDFPINFEAIDLWIYNSIHGLIVFQCAWDLSMYNKSSSYLVDVSNKTCPDSRS